MTAKQFTATELANIAKANAKAKANGTAFVAPTGGKATTTHTAPSKLEANAKATAKAEGDAKASNTAKLAANAKRLVPTPKAPLQKGSGALIGVAQGAMDGQPHTKQAVAEARAKASQAAKEVPHLKSVMPADRPEFLRTQAVGKVQADFGGNKVWCAPSDPWLVNGVLAPNATIASDLRKAAEAKAAKPTHTVLGAGGKPAKAAKAKTPTAPKTPRAPAADRKYSKGANTYGGLATTWTHYMIQVTLRNKSTDAAKADHAKSAAKAGFPPAKPLDFKWMDMKGFIKLA